LLSVQKAADLQAVQKLIVSDVFFASFNYNSY